MTKRHFLFLHSGSAYRPTRARGPIDISLAINYPAGPLRCYPKKEKVRREREKKKIRLNYFSKADFFPFLLLKQETLSDASQKAENIYNIKKSSVVGFGIEWDPEH